MKNRIRVIFDTNIWISFLITNQFNFLDNLLRNNKITLLFSQEFLEEFLEVVLRPKFQEYFTKEQVDELFYLMNDFSEKIDIHSNTEICRDKKDNFLLDLAKDGNADYLITGDKDLLVLNPFENTKIITIREFKEIVVY